MYTEISEICKVVLTQQDKFWYVLEETWVSEGDDDDEGLVSE